MGEASGDEQSTIYPGRRDAGRDTELEERR